MGYGSAGVGDSEKRKLLFVVPYNPLPASEGAKGPKNVTAPLIEYLSAEFDLTLVVISRDEDLSENLLRECFPLVCGVKLFRPHGGLIRAAFRLFFALRGLPPILCDGRGPGFGAFLRKYAKQSDLVHLEYFTLASWIHALGKICPTFIHGHDAYSLYQFRRAAYSSSFSESLNAFILKKMFERLESRLLSLAQTLFVVSPVDEEFLLEKGVTNVKYLPPALLNKRSYLAQESSSKGLPRLLVIVPPLIRKSEVEQLKEVLAELSKLFRQRGSGPIPVTFFGRGIGDLKFRNDSGDSLFEEEYVEYVEDYDGFLSSRRWVAFYPIRVGAGLHTKLRDVMLLGHPVVGYSEIMAAFGGQSLVNYIECGSTPEAAGAIGELLLNAEFAKKVGILGRDFVLTKFGADNVCDKYLAFCDYLNFGGAHKSNRQFDFDRLQSVQKKIACDVVSICDRYNINYFLVAGTLLGAVRHHGFIPWDDDLDIGMLRSDYDRFLAVAAKELSGEYFLQTYFSDKGMPFSYAKVRLSGSVCREASTLEFGWHDGIFIDIFPLDKVPLSIWGRAFQKVVFKICFVILLAKSNFDPKWKKSELLKRNLYLYILRPLSRLFSRDLLIEFQERVARISDSEAAHKLVVLGGAYGYDKEIVDASWFEGFVDLPFGQENFRCPKGWDAYLKNLYGDYHVFPPFRYRGNRHQIVELKFKDAK